MTLPTASSFLSLNIDNITFTITKAHITESLESLWSVECEGYIESLQEQPFSLNNFSDTTSTDSANPYSLNFHPNVLINQQAYFKITNPYPNNTKTLDFTNSSFSSPTQDTEDKHKDNLLYADSQIKEYKGVLFLVEYLGLNTQSGSTILNTHNHTPSLASKHFFNFTLRSPLYRMSLNKANRIYTNTSIIEAIQATMSFYEQDLLKPLDFSHIHSHYPSLELITQYNESDLSFITRLAHNNGIYFYDDAKAIYFYDLLQKQSLREIAFNPNIHNTLNEPCISSVSTSKALRATTFSQSSEEAANPLNLQSLTISPHTLHTQEDTTSYSFKANTHSYSSQYSFSQESDIKTPLSLQEKRLQVLEQSLQAQSNIYDIHLHDFIRINFSAHSKDQQNIRDFFIVAIDQTLYNEAILENTLNTNDNVIKKANVLTHHRESIAESTSNSHSTHSHTSLSNMPNAPTPINSYTNTLTLLPTPFSFTPSLKQKPNAPSSTLGIVIGESEDIAKEANTLYTDSYGRVRVRINAFATQALIDTYTTQDTTSTQQDNTSYHTDIQDIDNTHTTTPTQKAISHTSYHYSPFLRVLSPIASNGSGFFALPRVGDEVIISYLDNDIDKPYISGSLYNQNNPTLASLPQDDHITALSARTINNSVSNNDTSDNTTHTIEQGSNELIFSNVKDKEQIYIKAQKDYEESINHNFTQNIKNNKDANIQGNYTERIQKTHTQTIDLAKSVNIGGEYLTSVALSKDTIVGGSHTLNIGASNKIRIAKDSEESVGGDKSEEIGGKLNTSIEQDEIKSVKGNKKELVEGDVELDSIKGLNYRSQEHINLQAINYIDIFATESFSTQTDKQHTETADSKYSEIQTNYSVNAGNQILHQVGDTQIIAKGNSVIIKAGGVEVVIDSNGLMVKGGEIKAE